MKRGAGVIVIRKDRAVLLQLRENRPDISFPGLWTIPGGGRESNEKMEQTAKRELKEETGYQARSLKFLGSKIYTLADRTKSKFYIYWTLYDVKQKIGQFEGEKIEFVTVEKFDHYKFIPHIKGFCLKAISEAGFK